MIQAFKNMLTYKQGSATGSKHPNKRLAQS